MGLLTFVGRVVLVVLNIIFIILSLALVIGGFILRFAHEWFRPQLKKVLDAISEAVNALFNETINTDKLELGSLVSGVAIAMIVIGGVLLIFAFVGCCGACCNISTIMLVYAIVLIVLLIAQIVIVIVAFGAPDQVKPSAVTAYSSFLLLTRQTNSGDLRLFPYFSFMILRANVVDADHSTSIALITHSAKSIKTRIKPPLKTTLDEYQGIKGTTLVSLGWNWAMQEFDCCGIDNYNDFASKGTWQSLAGDGANVITPIACCKSLPTSIPEKENCAGKAGDTISIIAAKSNYDKSCVDIIWTRIVVNKRAYYLPILSGIFAAQVAMIIFAILIYKDRGITGGLV